MGSGQSPRRGLSGRERGRPEERMGGLTSHAAGMPLARRRERPPPPQSAKRGRRSSRKGWDPANHRDGVYPGGKGDDQKKGWGPDQPHRRTVTPPRRHAATAAAAVSPPRAAIARGRLAGTHRLAIVERTPRHRALSTRAHRRARAPRTTLGPTVTVALPMSIGTPSTSTCEAGAAKRRRRTRCSTRKPDRETPAHECFT